MLSDPEPLPDKTDPAKMPGQNFFFAAYSCFLNGVTGAQISPKRPLSAD